jgi:CBS domain-containing protein
MTIGTLCAKPVARIRLDATVADAALLMRASHVGDLVVVDGDGQSPVGIITDHEIVVEVIGQGFAPTQIPVASVMSTPLLALHEEDGLLEALEQMAARGVRRAPIVDRHGHLKGLVSMDDVVPLLARELAKISVLIRREQTGEVRRTEDVLQDEFAT